MEPEILFEDENLLVCVKNAGVLSQKGDGENMIDLLSCGGRQVYPVHRLDREVGGVMVYAKTADCASILSKLVSDRKIEKTYLAVCIGAPDEKSGRLEDLLFRDSAKNKSYVVKRERRGVKKAILDYECLDYAEDGEKTLTLLKVKLVTGRTHQIRVQFSSRKHPLLGDGRYGGKDGRCGIALWSYSLSFVHPYTDEKMSFSCGPGIIFPWNKFKSI